MNKKQKQKKTRHTQQNNTQKHHKITNWHCTVRWDDRGDWKLDFWPLQRNSFWKQIESHLRWESFSIAIFNSKTDFRIRIHDRTIPAHHFLFSFTISLGWTLIHFDHYYELAIKDEKHVYCYTIDNSNTLSLKSLMRLILNIWFSLYKK